MDDIFLSLASAFPGMALPTKELIYQTLEKLTRERKIYQTAQGYFVVTPDTHRYIMSTEPLLMMQSQSSLNRSLSRAEGDVNTSAATSFLRNVILYQQGQQTGQQSKWNSFLYNSVIIRTENIFDGSLYFYFSVIETQDSSPLSAKQNKNRDQNEDERSLNAPSPDPDTYSLPYGTFRRCGSLRIQKKKGCSV